MAVPVGVTEVLAIVAPPTEKERSLKSCAMFCVFVVFVRTILMLPLVTVKSAVALSVPLDAEKTWSA